MAFDQSNLGKLCGSDGWTLWRYTTADTDTVLSTSGYFNAAADMLRIHDVIYVSTATGGTAVHGQVVVISNASGVVDVGDINTLAVVDTE